MVIVFTNDYGKWLKYLQKIMIIANNHCYYKEKNKNVCIADNHINWFNNI